MQKITIKEHLIKTNMKQFFKQCMLFKSEDKIDKIIGALTWIALTLLLTQITIIAYLINNLINN